MVYLQNVYNPRVSSICSHLSHRVEPMPEETLKVFPYWLS